MRINFTLTACISLIFPPCRLKNQVLRWLGWQIESNCRVGFSWISVKSLKMEKAARINSANFIQTKALIMEEHASIGSMNRINGPLYLIMSGFSAIGNQNTITRAGAGVSWGTSLFKLGCWSKLTVGHVIDCTRSVLVGDYTTFAGRGTQVWTHGYVHAPAGLERYRVDGAVKVGSNVYIGSSCVLNAGVTVGDRITVGAASCISRSLVCEGLYVSQPLRHIDVDYYESFDRYPEVKSRGLVERVVNKQADIGI